jgi:hypothetical protein
MLSVYLETTVFGRYFEDGRDYNKETKTLFDVMIPTGDVQAYTSSYVVDELEKAPEPKRSQMLELIERFDITVLEYNPEAEKLALSYTDAEIIPVKFMADAVHIAVASVNSLECIVSLNFRHINKLKTKLAVEIINKVKGYGTPFIVTPMEIIS